MFRKVDFMQWMDEFLQKKSNELQYSQTMSPKRMQKVTYDLSAAPTRPVLLAVPFSTIIISRIYSTATPATDKAGSLKVMFDSDDDANVQNAISLYPNDSLRLGVLARQAFFTWTAQADTSVDFYVFPDIEVIAGTTKTQIVGSTTVVNTTAWKYPAPSSIQTAVSDNGGVDGTYTIPAGKYGWLTMSSIGTGTWTGTVRINGVYFHVSVNTALSAPQRVYVKAGDVILCSTTGADSKARAYIEVYDL